MVVRDLINCSTCKTAITIRIWVGHNSFQQHTFLCPNCKEEITMGMDVNFETVSTSIKYIENCTCGNDEGEIINLNPHFVFDREQIGADKSFPWMKQAQYIQKMSGIKLPERPEGQNGIIMFDSYQQLGGILNITEMWTIIKKGWSLENNKQHNLSKNILRNYSKFGYDNQIDLANILYDFCVKVLVPRKIYLVENAMDCLKKAVRINREEVLRFKDYYLHELKEEHIERYFELFSEYFRDYAEYDQTILYIKNVVSVPEGCVATSSSFKNTKMFYGNAFEIFTSNIVILACINNIIEGRKFDEFETMNLKKYLTINKANSFKNNPDLKDFIGCIDSTLRNASHHGSTRLIKHQKFIEFRSGGTGAKQEISYSRYLEKCGDIMLTSVALLILELAIAF